MKKSKSKEMIEEEIYELRKRGEDLLSRLPINHNEMSYQKACEYKDAAYKLRCAINRQNVSLQTLVEALDSCEIFYG